MESISKFKLDKCPKTIYYIPNFITEEEENFLLDSVYKVPKTKWTNLSNRRLQNWGGIPHTKGMLKEPIPKWLLVVINQIEGLKILPENCKPNHVLVNEYLPGQGIMPHTDGPLYYPVVSTITLASHTVLELEKRNNKIEDSTKFKLLLERRSLVVLMEEAYNDYLHGISQTKCDSLNLNNITNVHCLGNKTLQNKIFNEKEVSFPRQTRISLTIRNVPKTSKFKLQIGK